MSLKAEESFDVVIVGAGMVGGTLACALALNSSLKIALIEAAGEPQGYSGFQFDPRVVALSEHSRLLLESVGVWKAIEQSRVCPYLDMDVWDAEGTGRIGFSCRDSHEPCLGHIVENSVIVRALYSLLREHKNIRFYEGVGTDQIEINEPSSSNSSSASSPPTSILPHVLNLTNGERLTTSLVIAADGASSKLREAAGIDTREWDYGHKAIVTTVQTEKDHNFVARQRFTSDGPLAFLPLVEKGSERYCSIVWSLKTERANEALELDDVSFCEVLGREFEYCLGSIVSIDKRYAIPLRQRHAKSYIKPGLALVGDAAHTIHPLAGQGVNLGLYDVEALAIEIKRSVTRKLSLSDPSILRRYERGRMSHNLATMGAMEFFKRLYGSESPYLRTLRNEGMRFFDNQTWLKGKFANLARGFY